MVRHDPLQGSTPIPQHARVHYAGSAVITTSGQRVVHARVEGAEPITPPRLSPVVDEEEQPAATPEVSVPPAAAAPVEEIPAAHPTPIVPVVRNEPARALTKQEAMQVLLQGVDCPTIDMSFGTGAFTFSMKIAAKALEVQRQEGILSFWYDASIVDCTLKPETPVRLRWLREDIVAGFVHSIRLVPSSPWRCLVFAFADASPAA